MTHQKVGSRQEWQAARDELLAEGARDVTMLLVSRAPLAKPQSYKKRMGWNIDSRLRA